MREAKMITFALLALASSFFSGFCLLSDWVHHEMIALIVLAFSIQAALLIASVTVWFKTERPVRFRFVSLAINLLSVGVTVYAISTACIVFQPVHMGTYKSDLELVPPSPTTTIMVDGLPDSD